MGAKVCCKQQVQSFKDIVVIKQHAPIAKSGFGDEGATRQVNDGARAFDDGPGFAQEGIRANNS